MGGDTGLSDHTSSDSDKKYPYNMDRFQDNMVKMGINSSTRPDYSHFRFQLWQTMQLFPEKCTGKSRIYVPLLFRFIK